VAKNFEQIKALTFRFVLQKLTEEEPAFINPDQDLKLEWAGRLGKAIRDRSYKAPFRPITFRINV
jgi:hypothetical protein